jgi:putative hydrolase of HD superfamily
MCLIHDLGEAFTGDIPTFDKTQADEAREEELLFGWVRTLPEPFAGEMAELYNEMAARKAPEARLYKALDKLEAVIQHNESDIASWLPLEYDLQLTYGQENMQFSEYLKELRASIDDWTREKIAAESDRPVTGYTQLPPS